MEIQKNIEVQAIVTVDLVLRHEFRYKWRKLMFKFFYHICLLISSNALIL